jgi:hypothetical protein
MSVLIRIKSQIEEICRDPALRIYGFLLALTHALTAWWLPSWSLRWLTSDVTPICWPLFPGCEWLHVASRQQAEFISRVYGAAAIIIALHFLFKAGTRVGYFGLLALTLFKAFIVLIDFRMSFNQHYMTFFVSMIFLFLPQKRQAIMLQIALFYFWAGTIKLNAEWLSGANLYRPTFLFTGDWIKIACAYVVILEMVIVWGLFARRGKVFWVTLAQFIVFHIFSWPVVGYFYPLLMFVLIAIFALDRLSTDHRPISELWRGRDAYSAYLILVGFSVLQIVPYLFPGDHVLTGEGRSFSLNMFDGHVDCQAKATVTGEDGQQWTEDVPRSGQLRLRCDPIVFWGTGKARCRSRDWNGTRFRDFDLFVDAKRTTDQEFKPLIRISGFCATDPEYHSFRHNEWILTE